MDDNDDESAVASQVTQPSAFGERSLVYNPQNDILAHSAITVVTRTRVFPGQKFLHKSDLKYSTNSNSFCQILMTLCNYRQLDVAADKAWFKVASKLASKTLNQIRNSRNTSMKVEYHRK